MISIRKHIDSFRVQNIPSACEPPQTDGTAVSEYRALLNAVGCSADRAVHLPYRLGSKMSRLERSLQPPVSPDLLAKTSEQAQADLSEWADRAATYQQDVKRELQEVVAVLASTADSLTERDAKYHREITDLTGRLTAVAEETDLTRIRRSILENTRILKDCVDRMAEDSKNSVDHLTAEVKEYRTRLREAERVSETDLLTNLANRRCFEKHLQGRVSSRQPFCLILIDLNDFKLVNDRFGHVAGDDLLKQFGGELKGQFGPLDVVGRWGGDEFVVIIPGRMNEARVAMARICKWALGDYKIAQGEEKVRVTLSAAVGAAEWDGHETGPQLLSRADREVYQAKAPSIRARRQ